MIGQSISHYKILEKLGEGGMGVVYKAHDTKLDRDVALKFLPQHLAASEQDKARFVQEAKAAAALNHPNVCSIIDIQEHEEPSIEGTQLFIVMEYVDGQTLRDVIGSSTTPALPMKRVLDVGIQIAEGLAAAHEKGIVHRDIKPENIMIRKDGMALIMDFGLAKLRASGSKISRLTKQGSTVGTAGYMSPEQVQGLDADHRSDIFSLGVVLYELFTGQLPFKGVHETALAYEIVNVDPVPMSATKGGIDAALDAIVLECLEKDPKERTQSAGQVAVDLKRFRRESSRMRASRITNAPSAVRSSAHIPATAVEAAEVEGSTRSNFPWTTSLVIAVVMLVAGYGISYLSRPQPLEMPVIKASIDMPKGIRYASALGGHSSISPDGSMIVFAGADSLSQEMLYIRQLKSDDAHSLAGTERAQYPFWSPDSRSIGFFADGKLKTIDARGGPVLTLADAPFGRGGAWSKKGEIIYSPSVSDPHLYAIPASGGTSRTITTVDSTGGAAPRFPSFLPDGTHFVFARLHLQGTASASDAYVGSLDNPSSKEIIKGVSNPVFASGYIFFLRQAILMAQPFDPTTLTVSGEPVALQGGINSWMARAKADFSLSKNGVLLYAGSIVTQASEFIWVKPDGSESLIVEATPFTTAVLSPDGSRIAYDEHDGQNVDIWIYEIESRVKTRLTFSEQSGSNPCWSHDGKKIYFNQEVGGSKANIFAKRSDGSGEQELIARGNPESAVGYYTEDASPDGRFLLIRIGNESGSELATLDLHDSQRPLPVVKLGIRGSQGHFSPDGKWIVYQSEEAGSARIYVSSFGGKTGKWQLPSQAGRAPHWSQNKIFYYSAQDRYNVVDVSLAAGSPAFSEPKSLFPAGQSQNNYLYGASGDGKRFLGMRTANASARSSLSILANWKGLIASKSSQQ